MPRIQGCDNQIIKAWHGSWHRSLAPLPAMLEQGEGVVINIGSVSGKTGEANGAAYSASKFGLIGFTQSLYEEVRERVLKCR